MNTTPVNRAEESRVSSPDAWWQVARDLYRGRRIIILVVGFVAVASVVISLLLPKYYTASTRVIAPEDGGSLSAMVLGNLPSSARALLGGSSGDYTRYLAILTSRAVLGSAVERFSLVDVYDVADAPDAFDRAIEMLRDQSVFYVDLEYDFLEVAVTDRDPQRAADLANFLVGRLNELNGSLSSQSAGLFRKYVESRYNQAFAKRDSVLREIESFQRSYGLFNLPAQTEAFFQQVADTRSSLIESEIRYESLVAQYGTTNPQVQAAGSMVRAARKRYNDALAGSEAVLPVSQDTIPAVARQYANLELERLIQDTIIETIAPVLEQAQFEEQRETVAVQVLDAAEAPFRKSHPRRSIIVIMSVFAAGILAVFYVILSALWRRNAAALIARVSEPR